MNLVPGFVHNPGIHCGSAAMRNIFRHLGRDYPEELLFGLGEGLSFIYVDEQDVPPFLSIHGRSLDLEKVLSLRMGLEFREHRAGDGDEAWEYVREQVDAGRPVLINTDIRYLDYFGSGTHFSGHRVVVAGYDGARGAYISDSEFPSLMEISLASLKAARESTIPPFSEPHCSVVITGLPEVPADEEFVQALVNCSRKMVFPDDPLTGIPGMLRASLEMPGWHAMSPTPDFAARFAYQVIEKRGTGGGFFRNMYGRFLLHTARRVKAVRTSGLIEDMNRLASKWSVLAAYFRALSENCRPSGFESGGRHLSDIMELEERYHKKVLNIFT